MPKKEIDKASFSDIEYVFKIYYIISRLTIDKMEKEIFR
jgi:hypothetical protein